MMRHICHKHPVPILFILATDKPRASAENIGIEVLSL